MPLILKLTNVYEEQRNNKILENVLVEYTSTGLFYWNWGSNLWPGLIPCKGVVSIMVCIMFCALCFHSYSSDGLVCPRVLCPTQNDPELLILLPPSPRAGIAGL